MGDRYFLTVTCPQCQYIEYNVYYAPTCGFIKWDCPSCGAEVDLEKLTGISYEDASNREEIKKIVEAIRDSHTEQ